MDKDELIANLGTIEKIENLIDKQRMIKNGENELIGQFGKDTGSSEVQISQLTTKIDNLSEHIGNRQKDKALVC